MRVDDVLECCIYAADVEVSGAFYRDVIGLESFSTAAGRHEFFRCGDRVFLLFNPERTAASEDVPPHGANGPGHVAFSIAEDGMPAWREHLDRCGVRIEREVEWPSGARSIYLRDPAGNSVELAPVRIWDRVLR
ncbi:glyoxalase/bleomycin resistance/extradiol dioxygenase family protein [soil metagenome]